MLLPLIASHTGCLLRRITASLPLIQGPRVHSLDVSKEFTKDIVLYKNDNLKHLRRLQFAAFANFVLFTYVITMFLKHFRLPLSSTPADEDKKEAASPEESWWKALFSSRRSSGESHTRKVITGMCVLAGHGGLAAAAFYSTRSVNTLVVRRGGTHVTLLTSRAVAISRLRQLTVPLTDVSCVAGRSGASPFVKIKIKGQPFFFILDKKGTFYNTYLFDRTVGLLRRL